MEAICIVLLLVIFKSHEILQRSSFTLFYTVETNESVFYITCQHVFLLQVLNYARLYGAGIPLAASRIGSCRPELTDEQRVAIAKDLQLFTKGKRARYVSLVYLWYFDVQMLLSLLPTYRKEGSIERIWQGGL